MKHEAEQIDWSAWRATMATLPPLARLVVYEMAGVMWARGGLSRMSCAVADIMRATGLEASDAMAAVSSICMCNADVTRNETECNTACNADVTLVCNANVMPMYAVAKTGLENPESIVELVMPERDIKTQKRIKNRDRVRRHRACNANVTLERDEEKKEESERASEKERTKGKGKEKVKEEIKEGENCIYTKRTHTDARVREYADEEPRPLTGGGMVVVQPPTDLKQVMDAAAVQGIRLTEDEAARFFDYYAATGWLDKNGRTYADWRRLIRGHKVFMDREKQKNGNNLTGGDRLMAHAVCGNPNNTDEDYRRAAAKLGLKV